MVNPSWQLTMGARPIDGGRVRFRVPAPAAHSVEVELYPWPGGEIDRRPMSRDSGIWSVDIDTPVGTLYRYRLDGTRGYPDPYSRSQPEGVHGPSQVVDPAFAWSDADWHGLDPESLVIYELHVGAYTSGGTFDAIIPQLDLLRELGVSAIELMPVSEFPGKSNWGYDGASAFAPASVYGGPDGLRRLVDAAHARGLGVMLDVVYNHLGPDGDYLHLYLPDALTSRYQTPWGEAVNFDGENCAFVRQYVIDNALYWLHEFHIDGLRLDAAHEMFDSSQPHILQEIADAVHQQGPSGKRCLIVAEDRGNQLRLIAPPEQGGYGFDGMWVDDFHHSVYVRLTGQRESYLEAYAGTNDEIARLLNSGLLYSDAQGVPPDAVESLPAPQLIYCLQNHDQVGNAPLGRRLAELAGNELYKAAYALLLLVPGTPMMFMGDEFAASTPFLYFTDLNAELARLSRAGRTAEFQRFWTAQDDRGRNEPDPQDESTFLRSKLAFAERDRPPHDGVLRLFRELLSLRRNDEVLRAQDRSRLRAEAVSNDVLLVERWSGGQRRLLVVNFGESAPFAHDGHWLPLLCTAEERFAGPGVDLAALRIEKSDPIGVPGRAATLWASG